tara:strand:+ start:1271 stop:1480 length:210 start_codon:yes stop_codon:yes gene_type:complete
MVDKEDKLLLIFNRVHPDFKDSKSCTVEIIEYAEWDEEVGTHINVMKNGYRCWGYTDSELLFEYITLGW